MTVDLTSAELKAIVHALSMRISVFSDRLREQGGQAEGSWRLIRRYIHDDMALRDKLRSTMPKSD